MENWPTNGIGNIENILPNTLLYQIYPKSYLTSYMAFCTLAQYNSLTGFIDSLPNRGYSESISPVTSTNTIMRLNQTTAKIYKDAIEEKRTVDIFSYFSSKLSFNIAFTTTNNYYLQPNGGKEGDVYLLAFKSPEHTSCTNDNHYFYINRKGQYATKYNGAGSAYPSYYTFNGNKRSDYTYCFGIIRYGDSISMGHAMSASEICEFKLLKISSYTKRNVDRYEYPGTEQDGVLRRLVLGWDTDPLLNRASIVRLLEDKIAELEEQIEEL